MNLKKLHESHGFLRGMVAFVGFKQTFIEYERSERATGVSNYNRYLGSLRIALNGIVGFSIRPLQIATIFGGIIAVFAFLLGLWILV